MLQCRLQGVKEPYHVFKVINDTMAEVLLVDTTSHRDHFGMVVVCFC